MDRAVIFGASRGLGAALAQHLCTSGYPVQGWGRKEPALKALRERYPLFEYQVADFSKLYGQDQAIQALLTGNFSRVFCVAGGGPYGLYGERPWSAHEWAWQVTFLFPAQVLHGLQAAGRRPQVILIGSSVAESEADPRAASYAAAKHALLGLYRSLRAEVPEWDVRLFSPGYMDTDLLPPQASVRAGGVYNPAELAKELWTWCLTADIGGHRVYPKHPN
jgi:3-dehydrosphinganine reductase